MTVSRVTKRRHRSSAAREGRLTAEAVLTLLVLVTRLALVTELLLPFRELLKKLGPVEAGPVTNLGLEDDEAFAAGLPHHLQGRNRSGA